MILGHSFFFITFASLKSEPMKSSSDLSPYSLPSRNRTFEVNGENTLLNFLFEQLKDQSKTTVKSLLAHRQIIRNGKAVTQFDAPLNTGDIVRVIFDKNQIPLEHPQLDLIYEDEFLIVIDKKAGLLSMGTEQVKEKTAYRILSDYVKRSNPRNCIFILHRLDRETSGLMMFAKTKSVQEQLQKNWNETVTERKYLAVVEGKPEKEEGIIKSYIKENKAFLVHQTDSDNGKLAVTRYRIIKSNSYYTLMELELETGRKNQIRVHMQELGHPVTGDKKYGAQHNPIHRLALHAFKLCFIHPLTGKTMHFETSVPKRFALLVKNRT